MRAETRTCSSSGNPAARRHAGCTSSYTPPHQQIARELLVEPPGSRARAPVAAEVGPRAPRSPTVWRTSATSAHGPSVAARIDRRSLELTAIEHAEVADGAPRLVVEAAAVRPPSARSPHRRDADARPSAIGSVVTAATWLMSRAHAGARSSESPARRRRTAAVLERHRPRATAWRGPSASRRRGRGLGRRCAAWRPTLRRATTASRPTSDLDARLARRSPHARPRQRRRRLPALPASALRAADHGRRASSLTPASPSR